MRTTGAGWLVPCTGDEKYGEIEGATAHMATLDGVGYQSYEVRKYHAYACEREYHDRSNFCRPSPYDSIAGHCVLARYFADFIVRLLSSAIFNRFFGMPSW
jgi:hypothetical protein